MVGIGRYLERTGIGPSILPSSNNPSFSHPLACHAYAKFSVIGNSDVRRAFGLGGDRSQASGIIKGTPAVGLIKPVDSPSVPRNLRYVSFWG